MDGKSGGSQSKGSSMSGGKSSSSKSGKSSMLKSAGKSIGGGSSGGKSNSSKSGKSLSKSGKSVYGSSSSSSSGGSSASKSGKSVGSRSQTSSSGKSGKSSKIKMKSKSKVIKSSKSLKVKKSKSLGAGSTSGGASGHSFGGGSKTGGSTSGGSMSGGSKAGGSITGGSMAGGSKTGDSMAGGSTSGGSMSGGSKAGGSMTGGSMASGSKMSGSMSGASSAGGGSGSSAGGSSMSGAGGGNSASGASSSPMVKTLGSKTGNLVMAKIKKPTSAASTGSSLRGNPQFDSKVPATPSRAKIKYKSKSRDSSLYTSPEKMVGFNASAFSPFIGETIVISHANDELDKIVVISLAQAMIARNKNSLAPTSTSAAAAAASSNSAPASGNLTTEPITPGFTVVQEGQGGSLSNQFSMTGGSMAGGSKAGGSMIGGSMAGGSTSKMFIPSLESSSSQAKQTTPMASDPSATELGNVISLPILTETPSRLTNFDLQQKADDETSTSEMVTSFTDAPMLNHVLSAESLVEGHCGSAALRPRVLPGKRQLLCARHLIDSSVHPIGFLLGNIGSFLNCCFEPTNALVRAALVSGGSSAKPCDLENDVALDICQVDERDSNQVSKIFQIETKPNLVTVTPSERGRVLFYDQTGRGIQLLPGSLLKLDGERITLWLGHVGQQSPTSNAGPTSQLEVIQVERPTRGSSVKGKNSNLETRSHKVEVTSGTATLLLWRTGPSARAQELTERNSASSAMDLMLVVESLAQCGGIAIDELLLWDERMHQAKAVEQARLDVAQVKKADCLAEGNFPALSFASAQVVDLAMEYLIFGSSRITAGLVAIGVLTGATVGFLHSPPATLKGMPGDNLHLHLALSDIHNRSLMEFRRRVFDQSEEARLRVTVGANAVVNLCGDQGGGWIVAPGSVLTLTCTRLVQLYQCAKSGAAPVRLETATQAVTLEDNSFRRLAINSSEATFLITDNAQTVAFYIH